MSSRRQLCSFLHDRLRGIATASESVFIVMWKGRLAALLPLQRLRVPGKSS